MEKLTAQNFDDSISKGVTFVDFYADWCGPCKMMEPIIEEVSKEMKEVTFRKVNVDEEQELVMRYKVMSVPMLILFKDGKRIQETVGFNSKAALITFIKRGL